MTNGALPHEHIAFIGDWGLDIGHSLTSQKLD